jgi:hypothetical protein
MPGANDATTQESVVEAYEDFSNVFDSLIEGSQENEATAATGEAAGEQDPAGNAAQSDQPPDGADAGNQPAAAAGDAPAADGQGTPVTEGGDTAGGESQSQAQQVDWEARFRELEAKISQQTQQPAASTEPAQTQQPAPMELYTAEEQTELADLKKDWPDLVRLFTLMGRQLQVDTLNYAFSEVGKVISPLQESVNAYSTNDHMAAIYEAHDDYDKVYQPVMDWIEQQPSFLKAAYQNVVKQGTAEEVSTMIQRFKDETGWKSAPQAAQGAGVTRPATPAAAASAPAQTARLSEAAMKAAKAMGAVGTKRGAQAAAQDPNDFDGAWAEANAA